MGRSVRHSSESRRRRMTARLEVLDRRTLLSGIVLDGQHAIHIERTAAGVSIPRGPPPEGTIWSSPLDSPRSEHPGLLSAPP
jgi:hypothetical protein